MVKSPIDEILRT